MNQLGSFCKVELCDAFLDLLQIHGVESYLAAARNQP